MCGSNESSTATRRGQATGSTRTTKADRAADTGLQKLRTKVSLAMSNMGDTKHEVKRTLQRRGHNSLHETLVDRFDNDIAGIDPKKGVMIAGDTDPVPFPDTVQDAIMDELIDAVAA